jgi:hypothetical protein
MMGGVSWSNGSQDVLKFLVIIQLKMEDAYILCDRLKFLMNESNQDRKMKAF